jgi:organic hydroperoxide reductase OsmC/OhrA
VVGIDRLRDRGVIGIDPDRDRPTADRTIRIRGLVRRSSSRAAFRSEIRRSRISLSTDPDPPMTTQPSSVRLYEVHARTSPVFGRVMCGARNHHFVVDGPVGNGCPGEAPTPAEIFLSAVAACGTEVIQVIARDDGVPLESVPTEPQAAALVAGFQRRCPLYGSVAVASAKVEVEHATEPAGALAAN